MKHVIIIATITIIGILLYFHPPGTIKIQLENKKIVEADAACAVGKVESGKVYSAYSGLFNRWTIIKDSADFNHTQLVKVVSVKYWW